MTMCYDFDLVCISNGPAGQATVVERGHLIGGVCVDTGTMDICIGIPVYDDTTARQLVSFWDPTWLIPHWIREAGRCIAPLNLGTACLSFLTVHSAENGVFEDSCPRGSPGTTSLILCSDFPCCFPHDRYEQSALSFLSFLHSPWLILPVQILSGTQHSHERNLMSVAHDATRRPLDLSSLSSLTPPHRPSLAPLNKYPHSCDPPLTRSPVKGILRDPKHDFRGGARWRAG